MLPTRPMTRIGKPLNIVHRDISPQNILIGSDGIARLVDFGVAKAAGRAQHSREGQLKGKLGYMAPEQLMANTPVTRQADIHAFATVFWEMLTGRRLFAGDSEADTVARIVRHDVPALSQSSLARGLPPAVDEVLRMGLAPDVEVRFSTALAICARRSTAAGRWPRACRSRTGCRGRLATRCGNARPSCARSSEIPPRVRPRGARRTMRTTARRSA